MKKLLLACALTALALPVLAKSDALSLIPNDAVSVGVVRIADMRSSPLSSTLFQQTDKISAHGDAEEFLREAGLQPTRDIDLVMVATSPRTTLGHDADVLVAAEGRFNVDRLTTALVSRGAEKRSNANGTYFILPKHQDVSDERGAVAFTDSHLALVGTEAAVLDALANRAAGGTSFTTASGLGRELSRIDPHATAWALVDVARAQRLTGGAHLPANNMSTQALNSALKSVSTVALWATDSGDQLKLGAFGLSNDPETLQLLEDTVRGALSAMRLAVQDKSPELVSTLRRFTVSHTDNSVTISGTVPAEAVRGFMHKPQTR
ncbi:MAG TPA: hypothetical protein VIO12_14145 [Thermoanaerobaculia bacterium]|jgi:hypothetical protein